MAIRAFYIDFLHKVAKSFSNPKGFRLNTEVVPLIFQLAWSLPSLGSMPDDNPSPSFPKTAQDINNLKQTAATAKDQVKDLGAHAVFETQDQLGKAKDSLSDLINSAKTYAAERPFLCLGLAFGLGLIIGKTHHLCCNNKE